MTNFGNISLWDHFYVVIEWCPSYAFESQTTLDRTKFQVPFVVVISSKNKNKYSFFIYLMSFETGRMDIHDERKLNFHKYFKHRKSARGREKEKNFVFENWAENPKAQLSEIDVKKSFNVLFSFASFFMLVRFFFHVLLCFWLSIILLLDKWHNKKQKRLLFSFFCKTQTQVL